MVVAEENHGSLGTIFTWVKKGKILGLGWVLLKENCKQIHCQWNMKHIQSNLAGNVGDGELGKIFDTSLFTLNLMLGQWDLSVGCIVISRTHLIRTRQPPPRPPPPRPPKPPPLPPPPLPPLGVQKTCPTRRETARADRTDLMAPDGCLPDKLHWDCLPNVVFHLSLLSDHTCDRQPENKYL